MNKSLFLAILCIVFSFYNMIDLYLTLKFIEYEVNPLVLYNFELFYLFKFISSIALTTIGVYKVMEYKK